MNKLNLQNTNCFRLFIILTLFLSSILSWGQTDLVRWNNTNYTPSYVASNTMITASNMTGAGGVNLLTPLSWDGGFFPSEGWPTPNDNSGSLNTSKYIEFSISANTGYQINLANFNFTYRAESGNQNLQIRYSKDNFSSYQTAIGNTTINSTWASSSANISALNPVLPGQTVKIRVYVHNTWNKFFVRYLRNTATPTDYSHTPTITGTVSAASPPVAVNDNAVTAENIPVTINILGNDTHSTLSSINITQQPANGQNITVNGTTNVTYTPNNGYTGTDSFKYTLTDGNGTSNEATVNINVIPVEAPTAIADNASVFMNQEKIIDVLANDDPGSGAFDEVNIVSGPDHGDLVINPDLTISYTPDNSYTGSDSFTYNVTNIHNATSNNAVVNINVSNPVGLVRWNGAGNSVNPEILVSNISSTPISNIGGTLVINNWGGNENFETGGWPTPPTFGGYLNEARYVEFTITANANYKIDLNQFNFEAQTNDASNGANFEVRYSKNFSEGYLSYNGTIGPNTSWGSRSVDLTGLGPVLPGETVYLRFYAYNTHNAVRIRQSAGGSLGPTITGVVSPYIAGDPADLGITLSMDPEEPNANDEVTITVEVENFGPNDATGVVVNSQLPAGFSYISDNSGGDYNPGTGVWELGDLEEGNTATLVITVEKEAVGPYTFSASVSHNGADANSVNDSGSITPTNACSDCTNTITTGTIVVGPGEVYCLHSGTWSDGVHLNGGTICIGEGATFSPAYIIGDNPVNGTIINRGTMNFNINNNKTNNVHIINYGQYNTTQLQNISGSIENYGTIVNSGGTTFATGGNMINEGTYSATNFQNFSGSFTNSGSFTITDNATFLSGASVINYGSIDITNADFLNTEVQNFNIFEVDAGFDFLGADGYFENKLGSTLILNPIIGATNITSPFDNSGTAHIYRANSGTGISTVVNNYGIMHIYQNIIFGIETYLTNDGTLEFHNAASVEFQGPLLQNNNLLTIFDGGNLSLNSPISQMVNNNKVVVEGSVSHNVAGSSIVNNCTILSNAYFVGNGTSENNGLIWVADIFELEGTSSILVNSETGFIRGANFRNSGNISGYGEFYFTGNTNFQSAGSFVGNDPGSPIKFFDVSQTGDQIFDVYVPDNPAINTIRPDSMTPYDETSYDCAAPPTTAGYPPVTQTVEISFCEPAALVFDLDDYVQPHEPVNGNPFTLQYSSIRLFDPNNEANPGNNTTSLTIAGKGTLTVNTITGVISFTPSLGFTSGTLEAQYRISNQWSGNPPVMPSARTMITISLHELPDLVIEDGVNPVCIGETISFSIDAPDATLSGVWQSSNPLVATVDSNGLVTGVSTGTAVISYTATLPSYPEGETCELVSQEEISVYNCACYKNPNLDPADQTTITGISAMQTPTRNWPEVIPNGFLALESSNKGLVITRVANSGVITDPQEGMIIYDIADKCVKLYNGTIWHCIEKDCN